MRSPLTLSRPRPRQQKDGLSTPADALTDFAEIGQAREKMLSIKLEQAGGDSARGSTNVDPKGYLTGLDSQMLKTSSEIGCVGARPLVFLSPSATQHGARGRR